MDLPDLKASVRISTADVDVAAAKVAAFGDTVNAEMDKVNAESKLSQAGQAFVKFGSEGEVASVRISSATAKTREDLDQLEARTRTFAEGLDRDFTKGGQAIIKLGEDGEAALGRFSKATEEAGQTTIASSLTFAQLFQGLGAVATGIGAVATGLISALVPALITTAVVLAPLIITVGAFAVGLTATLAVITLAVGGIAALAAGIVALAVATQGWMAQTTDVPTAEAAVADAVNAHQAAVLKLDATQKQYNATSQHTAAQTLALHQAQQAATDSALKLQTAQSQLTAAQTGAANPLERLKTDAQALADTLGQKAVPIATQLLNALDGLIAPVGKVGAAILDWFGQRLPSIFIALQPFIAAVGPPFAALGQILSHFFDMALSRSPALANVFGMSVGGMVGAISGLLGNLLSLADWFIARLPAFLPIIETVFGGAGSAIQGMGAVAGALVDWFLANWPQIAATATWVWAQIMTGWNEVKPMLQAELPAAVSAITSLFGFLKEHSDLVHDALVAVGAIVAVLVGALAGLAVVVTGALAGLELLYEAWKKVNDAISWVCDQIANLIGLLGKIPHFPGSGGGSGSGSPLPIGGGGGGGGGLAGGGWAMPNSIYTIGESGPETLVMGTTGGYVIPNAGGAGTQPSIVINVIGSGMSSDQVALAIDRRLSRMVVP